MDLVTSDWGDGVVCLTLDGRLDVNGVDAVERTFTETALGAPSAAAVDMSGVAFVASLGLRMFVAVARGLRAEGKPLVLFGCQPAVREVFELAALDDLIAIAPNEGAARARLA